MIAALIILALVIAALLVERQVAQRARSLESQMWASERSELLSRIQRPEYIPPPRGQNYDAPLAPPDDWNAIGHVIAGGEQ